MEFIASTLKSARNTVCPSDIVSCHVRSSHCFLSEYSDSVHLAKLNKTIKIKCINYLYAQINEVNKYITSINN